MILYENSSTSADVTTSSTTATTSSTTTTTTTTEEEVTYPSADCGGNGFYQVGHSCYTFTFYASLTYDQAKQFCKVSSKFSFSDEFRIYICKFSKKVNNPDSRFHVYFLSDFWWLPCGS